MKNIDFKKIAGTILIVVFATACSNDMLNEKPRSIYTPEYFKTAEGIQGGLTSLYSHLRYIYGLYYYNACQNGTDETTFAQGADNNPKDVDLTPGNGSLTPTSSRSDVLWNNAFSNINTANGIIENGATVGIAEALISEARFFRAFDYFMLVQTFGGVPLDLGSGELKFNTSANRTSKRNTVPEVYTKGIFPDLKLAIQNLPDKGRVTGGATKTVARLYLAKAYLTYGWWLQNPNNIPTYPAAGTSRTDPDGHDAAWYFQQAYTIATDGIKNAGTNFGLQATYYDVNVGSNDRNNEILLYADHIQGDEYYNQTSLSYSNGVVPENIAGWFAQWNYTNIKSGGVNSVQREAVQSLGRPWTRICPTIGVVTNTFADKTNDSRYDGTFTTVYRGNWNKAGLTNPTVTNANSMPVAPGGAILSFLDTDPTPAITYPSAGGDNAIGAGTLPGRSDYVISPSGISRIVYPGLWKIGTYRTDNGTGLGQPNGASTRPWNIAKFSELFLIAAEAAVKGATPTAITGTYANDGTARGLINVLRARAGKWKFSNAQNQNYVADNSAAMIAATPATIDINYILAERSREFYGEGYRWYDLVRTQKWAEIGGSYTICGSAYGNHTPQSFTRNIDNHYYLRPIPQGQIDALVMSDDEKKAYQNPGY